MAKAEQVIERRRHRGGGGEYRFFYSQLSVPPEGKAGRLFGRSEFTLGCADHLIELYGIREFLADLDRNREYWRDGGGLVADVLDWMAGPGFHEFFSRFNFQYGEAAEFKQRYLLKAMRGIVPSR